MKPLFSFRCHKRIDIPQMVKGGNIKSVKPVKLGCADKNCANKGGHALYKIPQKVEEIVS